MSCYEYSYIAAFGRSNDGFIYIYEIIFLVDMAINFLTELPSIDNNDMPERKL